VEPAMPAPMTMTSKPWVIMHRSIEPVTAGGKHFVR